MKIVVVGGVAGGASAAARARRLDESAEIVVFERGGEVSYSNCSLPYYLSGTVADRDSLIMMTKEAFKARFNIDVRTLSEVVSIDRKAKTVHVKEAGGHEYDESYDKLILSPGASPILPKSIAGIDKPHVFSVRNVDDIVRLKNYCEQAAVETVAVVGGGFVGVEVAENLKDAGKNVVLIEGMDQILAPFDYDMVQILHKEMLDHGVDLRVSSMLKAIEEDAVVIERDGEESRVPAQAVVCAIGVSPETGLAEDADLSIGALHGIRVNEDYQTDDPDIYAVGDAIEVKHFLTGEKTRLALAGPAQRQARGAADHIYGIPNENRGVIGSCCIRVFGKNAAATGLNERSAAAAGFECDSVLVFPNDKVGIMPSAHYMAFKLIYEIPSGRILGAQAIGAGDVTGRCNVIAAMITMKGTLEDLRDLEVCYAPLFGTAKDIVNFAAYVGLNVLHGVYKQVHVSEIRYLVESGAFIVDVREPAEYEAGHLKGARNIPLSQLRERLDEIPKDRPVYLHCRSSQRSYYALRCLQGHGYENAVNISGSYLGFSYYEYFNDKDLGREPILTEYNFD